ncbi:unnamed protein product [Cylicocyclus nassatus]|uniref:Uncharacterized protein n=1 Tax=Cylicocyclus nassatus TaxID=53992 RepID=A0AA36HGD9_CYLNA|nr:unnamed protein product [Cylicocyclus nassatus]
MPVNVKKNLLYKTKRSIQKYFAEVHCFLCTCTLSFISDEHSLRRFISTRLVSSCGSSLHFHAAKGASPSLKE